MESHMKYIISTLLLGLGVSFQTFATESCITQLNAQLKSDLQLSYQEFDQTMGQGWRTLANTGCYNESVKLIERYIEVNNAPQNSLYWHLFQMLAYAGDTEQALTAAQKTLISNEQQANTPLLWNEYVNASAAFLKKDLNALKMHRANIAKGAQFKPNELNLKVVDRLITHFDQSYQFAYEGGQRVH